MLVRVRFSTEIWRISYLSQYVTIPRKLLISPTDVGGRASCIALIFAGSGETPSAEKSSLKKVNESL